MESIWSRTAGIRKREPLMGDMEVQTAVIGAGMAGILTAYLLKAAGMSVAVLEANRIGSGQTRNTTAKITSQHGMIYSALAERYGEKKAGIYARANELAITEFEKIIRNERISCHFERLPAYLYSCGQRGGRLLEQEARTAAKLGLPASFLESAGLPMKTTGAVRFERQAQFHPLEFLGAVSEKLKVYEETKVLTVKGGVIYTDRGNVRAEQIIFASHYPFLNVPGFYFARQHQDRSYVVAYRDAAAPRGMYYSVDSGGLSLRNYENLLLLGGGGHRTGERGHSGSYELLRSQAAAYFPGAQEVAHWSAQDCMTHDELPFIGRYSAWKKNWYVATGFRKWGMTQSMAAAILLRDELCGVGNPARKLFSPQRYHPVASAGRLAKDLGESVAGLTRGLFVCSSGHGCAANAARAAGWQEKLPEANAARAAGSQEKLPEANAARAAGLQEKLPEANAARAAGLQEKLPEANAARAAELPETAAGRTTKKPPRCTHMGCGLVWNADEQSWDCPCHGSRFDRDGNLIDNPAQTDLP